MNVEELREYCLSLSQAIEAQPWTEAQYRMLVVYEVAGKWFVLADVDKKFIDVKCDPEVVVEMQSRYQGAFPAWHMNKEHWLGITLDSDVPDDVIRRLLKDGYQLTVEKLSMRTREALDLVAIKKEK